MLGSGFVLAPEQAEELIQRDPRNKDVLFPYLNGEDLNSRPDCSASRWVINFHDWPEERAREYPEVFAIVERDVKPERLKNNRPARRDRWWQFAERAPKLYETIANLDRVLVVARVSKTALPAFIHTGHVISEAAVVFASNKATDLSLLSSGIHYTWAINRGSSLKGDLRYTPSDVYETLPQLAPTRRMQAVGLEFDRFRRSAMNNRQAGLTKLYNMVHNSSVVDNDIQELRKAHQEIDEAVAEAYGWTDLELGHGFHQTRQGPRFTIAPAAQTEVLDRLLELNHEQHGASSGSEPCVRNRKPGESAKLGLFRGRQADALF
nr:MULTISPECIES: type IIL restriction-modification enzyme MmeI [Streptomyces]